MVPVHTCGAAALGVLGVLAVTCLASTQYLENNDASSRHTTSTGLSMLRRHRQEYSSSPLLRVRLLYRPLGKLKFYRGLRNVIASGSHYELVTDPAG